MPKQLVRRIDRVDLSRITTLAMRQEECRLTDIAMSVPRIMIVAVSAIANLVVEESAMLRATLIMVALSSKGMTLLLQQTIRGLSTVHHVASEPASMTAMMVFHMVATKAASMAVDTVATEAARDGAGDNRVAQSLSLHLSRTR